MSGSRLRIKTKTGSVYVLDPVRKSVTRLSGGSHYAGRAVGKSEPYERVSTPFVGHRLVITWGTGRDEYSAGLPEPVPEDVPDEDIIRQTVTSEIVSIEPEVDCAD